MSKTVWLVFGAIVIIAGGAVWLSSATPASQTPVADQGAVPAAMPDTSGQGAAPNASDSGTSATVSADTTITTGPAMSATVTYNGSSFSPASVTIGKGGTVRFVDSAGSSMWVASAMHPAHTGYDDTSKDQHCADGYAGAAPFDQCGSGASYSFTFAKSGTWGYHDHRNASAHGTIIVQ